MSRNEAYVLHEVDGAEVFGDYLIEEGRMAEARLGP